MPDYWLVDRLVLVRHGESEMNVLQSTSLRRFCGAFDTPLTEKGRSQALQVGNFLSARKDLRLQVAITSTLSRTIDTARIALAQLSYDVPILPPNRLWDERTLGEFENRLATDVFEELPHYRNDPAFNRFTMDYQQKAPGGENFSEVRDRAIRGLREIEAELEGDVVVFTHGHLLRCLIGEVLQLSKEDAINMHVPNAYPIIMRRAGTKYLLEGEIPTD